MATGPVIEMRGISKTFPGVRALDAVSLTVHAGQIHALVGENGAGKSTLMKILAGAYKPDAGSIFWKGQEVRLHNPVDAQERGIAIIYQEFNLVPDMDVAENIFLGREPHRIPGVVAGRTMYRSARDILAGIGVRLDPTTPVRRLSVAQQQMVEIAKALSQRAEVIIMDEPSASLTGHELERLFAMIRTLQGRGVAVIYISHRLEEIFAMASAVTVLKDGRTVGTLPVQETSKQQLIGMMVGRAMDETFPPLSTDRGEPLLSLRHIRTDTGVQDVSLDVHASEIVGLFGLVGAGRTELARAVFGADRLRSGEVILAGRPTRITSPRVAARHGLGYVSEDRKGEGLVLPLSILQNMSMAALPALQRFGFVARDRERALAEENRRALDIRTPTLQRPVVNLSGGNQQKVVLAKWLSMRPRVLIFDEPTRGIDVGAKAEIYHLMRDLVTRGTAILMISSDLREVLGMSDRVVVMHEGRLTGELPGHEATEEAVMWLATGEKDVV